MRVDCHAHIFNLRVLLTSTTYDIVARRLVGDRFPSIVNEAVAELLKDHVLRPEYLEGDGVFRALAKKLAVGDRLKDFLAGLAGDVPAELELLNTEPIDELGTDAVTSLAGALAGVLRGTKNENWGDLRDLLETLRIGLKPRIRDVADHIMKQLQPDDSIVALALDITAGEDAVDDRRLLKEQLVQTAEAVLAHPGRIFPFVGVSSLRKEHFEILQTAVNEMGFVGVKIYPSMGFKIDSKDMVEVFEYCIEMQLPVLLHSNQSGFFRKKQHRDYCNPQHWRSLFEEHPQLRELKVCFGHFGGGGALLHHPLQEDSWAADICRLMEEFPGVYADFSFHTDPMESQEAQASYLANVEEMLGHATHGRRILFGTDAWLVRLRLSCEAYWRYFNSKLGDAAFTRIAEENPRRFLGLGAADGSEEMAANMVRHLDYLAANRRWVGAVPPAWVTTALQERRPDPVTFRVSRYGGEWTPNNEAHVRTYRFFGNEQMFATHRELKFEACGQLYMRQMKYWNREHEGAGVAQRKASAVARLLVEAMDRVAASFEVGFDRPAAEKQLAALLADGNNTLADVAGAVDRIFRFRTEAM